MPFNKEKAINAPAWRPRPLQSDSHPTSQRPSGICLYQGFCHSEEQNLTQSSAEGIQRFPGIDFIFSAVGQIFLVPCHWGTWRDCSSPLGWVGLCDQFWPMCFVMWVPSGLEHLIVCKTFRALSLCHVFDSAQYGGCSVSLPPRKRRLGAKVHSETGNTHEK